MSKNLIITAVVAIAVLAILISYPKFFPAKFCEGDDCGKNAGQTQPQTAKQDETANWKTYRNEEFGFEVKYPETIAGTKIKQRFIFQEFDPRLPEIFVGTIGTAEVPGLHLIGFRIKRKPSGFVNLDTYLKEVKDGCQKEISGGAAGGVCNIKKMTVGNEEIPAIVSTESSAVVNTSVILYFDKGSDIFLVSYDFAQGMIDVGDAKEKILFDTIQKILFTFRFTK